MRSEFLLFRAPSGRFYTKKGIDYYTDNQQIHIGRWAMFPEMGGGQGTVGDAHWFACENLDRLEKVIREISILQCLNS